jgi:RES domain-containing protein
MRIWRISNHADLSGRGGLLADGRWHRQGVPVVYCADHPSTAMLEVLVHVSRDAIPDTYQLIEIDIPESAAVIEIDPPPGWQENLLATQDLGSAFLHNGNAALLRVPSIVMPKATNLIVNPVNKAASGFTIAESWRYPFDSRLFT